MNIKKKLEKELLFKNNIKEITSISLDSEYEIKDNEIIGNFIITGEYKIHEVSINKENFNFKIPLKHELETDIDNTTVKLEITNFEYDYKKDELLVNIEYMINGDRKDVLIFDNEESLDEFLNNREVEVIDTRLEEINNNIENNQINEEIVNIENEEKKERNKDEIKPDKIIENINKPKDNFITYQVYKIKENDTLESIVLKYKTTLEDLKEYNDLNNIQINDKIIIPYYE